MTHTHTYTHEYYYTQWWADRQISYKLLSASLFSLLAVSIEEITAEDSKRVDRFGKATTHNFPSTKLTTKTSLKNFHLWKGFMLIACHQTTLTIRTTIETSTHSHTPDNRSHNLKSGLPVGRVLYNVARLVRLYIWNGIALQQHKTQKIRDAQLSPNGIYIEQNIAYKPNTRQIITHY